MDGIAEVLEPLRDALPEPLYVEGAFCVEAFARNMALPPAALDAGHLETLSRCIEVKRRLHAAYHPGNVHPFGDALARPEFACLLAGLYLAAGISRRDWKWLNTALKMSDGILLAPRIELPQPLTALIHTALEPPA